MTSKSVARGAGDKPTDIYKVERVRTLIEKHRMLAGLDKRLHEHIREAIMKAVPQRPVYNPYLYESLLTDVGRILDRCLAHRRECLDLESVAVRRALEYALFAELAQTERDLTDRITDTVGLSHQKGAQSSAAAQFANGDESLKPFAALYAGGADAAQAEITNQDGKRGKLKQKLTAVEAHQDLLEARHTTPGHALNYAERRDRSIRLIVPDIVEAFQKARAARAGLAQQLGLKDSAENPFPSIQNTDEDSGFLDRFVLWVRDTVRRYEIDTRDDIVFERIIPLRQAYKYDGKVPADDKRLVENDTFIANVKDKGNGLFELGKLADAIPAACTRVRIRGVGISVAWPGATQDKDAAAYQWSALVFPADQPDPYPITEPAITSEQVIVRSPAVLGNVGVFHADAPVELVSGEEVWNSTPSGVTNGLRVLVEPAVTSSPALAVTPEVRGYIDGKGRLSDIKLHLRLVATPSKNPAAWRNGF